MKKNTSKLLSLVAGIVAVSSISIAQATTLTEKEADTLNFMHQEEKLARDVYLSLHEKWGIKAFDNIAQSEQRHMNQLAKQLTQYELPNSITADSIGAFSNSDLQAMYETLMEKGNQSAIEALLVGAYIEELDIMDLQKAIDETDQASLDQTYENLMRGSRNHLRAFTRNLKKHGQTYTAQLMSQEDVDAIINTPREQGERAKFRDQRHSN